MATKCLYDSSIKTLGAAGGTFLFPSREKTVLAEKVNELLSYIESFDNISEILYNLEVNMQSNGTNPQAVQLVGDRDRCGGYLELFSLS